MIADSHGHPFADAVRANLRSDETGHLHPGLLSEFADTPGGRWWRKCFKRVLDSGRDSDQLARQVLSVEFHGYHAKHWRQIPVTLPSQPYGFWLVNQAIDRGAAIAVMRGAKVWEVAVPRLRGYRHRVRIRNPRVSTLSPANCGERGFHRVVTSLTRDD